LGKHKIEEAFLYPRREEKTAFRNARLKN